MPGLSTPEPISTALDSRMTGPKISRPALRSVDPVSTTSATASATPRRTADSTAPSSLTSRAGVTPVTGEEVADEARVARRDAHALEVGEVGEAPDRTGEAEGRVPEVERVDLDGVRTGVEQQVAARDADVERARAHVGGDVARAQVEELDVVAGVGDVQVAGVAATGVPGLAEHLERRSRRACPCWARRFAAWAGSHFRLSCRRV